MYNCKINLKTSILEFNVYLHVFTTFTAFVSLYEEPILDQLHLEFRRLSQSFLRIRFRGGGTPHVVFDVLVAPALPFPFPTDLLPLSRNLNHNLPLSISANISSGDNKTRKIPGCSGLTDELWSSVGNTLGFDILRFAGDVFLLLGDVSDF
jgi:hypothetical protein